MEAIATAFGFNPEGGTINFNFSSIIMAYPEATIYEIKENIEAVRYEETENYQIMKSFINNKNKMLDILIDDSN